MIKDATVKPHRCEGLDQHRARLQLFLDAYNHGGRLKTLRGLTPHEFVCQAWTKDPARFRLDPSHHIPGPSSGRLPGTHPVSVANRLELPPEVDVELRALLESEATVRRDASG